MVRNIRTNPYQCTYYSIMYTVYLCRVTTQASPRASKYIPVVTDGKVCTMAGFRCRARTADYCGTWYAFKPPRVQRCQWRLLYVKYIRCRILHDAINPKISSSSLQLLHSFIPSFLHSFLPLPPFKLISTHPQLGPSPRLLGSFFFS